jgi:phenylalanyl-tRNA synthetase alpha chain
MLQKLETILEKAVQEIRASDHEEALEKLRVFYLGKKGELTGLLQSVKDVAKEDRKAFGQRANEAKKQIEGLLQDTKEKLKNEAKALKLDIERIDVTQPAIATRIAKKHMITQTIDEISAIFERMGYSVAIGPEIETVFFNFDALNAAPNHPSRDLSDTFYFTENDLLRTQTSPVQVHSIIERDPPFKIISPGRCFRTDNLDATHSPMFHQVEGLIVDENVTMADLKGTLDHFAKAMFGEAVQTKFRPHFFPFTEPSAEMDMTCFKCGGKGCRVCKGSGFIEILGCGMVHPNVIAVGGIDTEKYTGFAFGMGVERIAMLKHGIDDIRLFYENDIRFVDQF